ncbi:GNAT family N-acetyltransferase [Mycobacterium simiae]|uniref:GNAT family N-acetyltransferase n=1 Tax=Mycobacterium simiae TaxID=1784 RepID=A0A5B1BI56_MYCSI|nr:GNAT family N-acetyltransferase [Mycobacterium simiae]KAA1247772.1 GNAT family N-acetyltransferase [Mycobacterium simiae]
MTAGDDLRPVELLSTAHDLTQFDSGVPELDRWLRNSARVARSAGTAATYILSRGDRVIAYYALAMNAVAHTAAPSRLRRGMPDPVPVVLLARLAVDRSEQGHRLGGYLLVDALRRCVRGSREFGARAVVVDAIDERAAQFYRHFDFHDLDQGRLRRRLSDITAALGE